MDFNHLKEKSKYLHLGLFELEFRGCILLTKELVSELDDIYGKHTIENLKDRYFKDYRWRNGTVIRKRILKRHKNYYNNFDLVFSTEIDDESKISLNKFSKSKDRKRYIWTSKKYDIHISTSLETVSIVEASLEIELKEQVVDISELPINLMERNPLLKYSFERIPYLSEDVVIKSSDDVRVSWKIDGEARVAFKGISKNRAGKYFEAPYTASLKRCEYYNGEYYGIDSDKNFIEKPFYEWDNIWLMVKEIDYLWKNRTLLEVLENIRYNACVTIASKEVVVDGIIVRINNQDYRYKPLITYDLRYKAHKFVTEDNNVICTEDMMSNPRLPPLVEDAIYEIATYQGTYKIVRMREDIVYANHHKAIHNLEEYKPHSYLKKLL
jgi:hypothetical protein